MNTTETPINTQRRKVLTSAGFVAVDRFNRVHSGASLEIRNEILQATVYHPINEGLYWTWETVDAEGETTTVAAPEPRRIQVLTPLGAATLQAAMKFAMREHGMHVYPKAVQTDWGRIIQASFYDAAHEGLYWHWETVGTEEVS